jgi:GntR family transcriptional regulator
MTQSVEPAIELRGGRPVHRQIEEQIQACIAGGLLGPGEELPTVRALAVGLAISPATVARAYDDLASSGWLLPADGSGALVAGLPAADPLQDLCREFLDRAAGFGVPATDALRALQALLSLGGAS